MDLTFQVPMQYCSLQGQTSSESTKSNCPYYLLQQILSQWHINHPHQTHHHWMLFLLWPGLVIFSGAISPLFPGTILNSYQPGGLIFCYRILLLFILFMGFLKQEYWSGLPFPSPVDHVLSELLTMTQLSWEAQSGRAHSFTELHKAAVHVVAVVSSVQASWWEELAVGNTSTSALLTMLKPLTVWIPNLWKVHTEMGIPDNLTYLLRNLCAGQEAIVRTGHGTKDWFKTGKEVGQGCIFSPCLFNLYAEYIMWNARLDESQDGTKIVISTASDIHEGKKKEWKSWLKTQHPKNEDHGIQSHPFLANRWGNSGNSDRFYFLGLQITADGDCSLEIKRCLLLGRKAKTNLNSVS